jgi:hypothetical protein
VVEAENENTPLAGGFWVENFHEPGVAVKPVPVIVPVPLTLRNQLACMTTEDAVRLNVKLPTLQRAGSGPELKFQGAAIVTVAPTGTDVKLPDRLTTVGSAPAPLSQFVTRVAVLTEVVLRCAPPLMLMVPVIVAAVAVADGVGVGVAVAVAVAVGVNVAVAVAVGVNVAVAVGVNVAVAVGVGVKVAVAVAVAVGVGVGVEVIGWVPEMAKVSVKFSSGTYLCHAAVFQVVLPGFAGAVAVKVTVAKSPGSSSLPTVLCR